MKPLTAGNRSLDFVLDFELDDRVVEMRAFFALEELTDAICPPRDSSEDLESSPSSSSSSSSREGRLRWVLDAEATRSSFGAVVIDSVGESFGEVPPTPITLGLLTRSVGKRFSFRFSQSLGPDRHEVHKELSLMQAHRSRSLHLEVFEQRQQGVEEGAGG